MSGIAGLLVLFVAAANPARHAGRLAGDGGGRRLVVAVGAVTVAALTAVVAAAGLADPLLDRLDITVPSARIAAGIVVAVAGVRDVLTSEPPPWEPVVVRPEVVLPAIPASADEGAVLTVLAAAIAVLATATFAAVGRRGAATYAAGRLLGAVLVVAGVDMVVDGVLDV